MTTGSVKEQKLDSESAKVVPKTSAPKASVWLVVPGPRMLLITLLVSFLTVMPGYYFAVVNNAEDAYLEFDNRTFRTHYGISLSPTQATTVFSTMTASLQVGMVMGALSSGWLAERLGRRLSLMVVGQSVGALGALATTLAGPLNAFSLLVVGRVAVGASNGATYALLALFLTEISRPRHRGFNAATENLMISLNSLLTLVVALPSVLGTFALWVPLNVLPLPFALLMILLSPLFPETPKFLFVQRGQREAARKAFLFYNPDASEEEVAEAFRSYEDEERLAASVESVSLAQALRTPHLRMPLWLSFWTAISGITTGIVVIFVYSYDFFKAAGLSADQATTATIFMSLSNCAGAVAANFLMDRWGRRVLLLGGLVVTTAALGLFMVCDLLHAAREVSWPAWLGMAAIFVHVFVFNVGPGPIGSFLSCEMTPQAARSLGTTITWTAGGVASIVVNAALPPLKEVLGAWAFLFLLLPNVLITAYLYVRLPETAGREVDDVVAQWLPNDYHRIQGTDSKHRSSDTRHKRGRSKDKPSSATKASSKL